MAKRMFTPRQQAWHHAEKLMNHLTLDGWANAPEEYQKMRDLLTRVQCMDLRIEEIHLVSDALQQAYVIGKNAP